MRVRTCELQLRGEKQRGISNVLAEERNKKVDVRLPVKGNSNSNGARPVYLIISMIESGFEPVGCQYRSLSLEERQDTAGVAKLMGTRRAGPLGGGGRSLFIKPQTRPLHANEENQTTRKGHWPVTIPEHGNSVRDSGPSSFLSLTAGSIERLLERN